MTKLNMSSLKKQKTDDLARESAAPVTVTPEPVPVPAPSVAPRAKTESPVKAKISLAQFRKEPEVKVQAAPVQTVASVPVIENTAEVSELVEVISSVEGVEDVSLVQEVETPKSAAKKESEKSEVVSKIELKVPKTKEFFPNLNIADTENFFKEFDEAGLEGLKKDEVVTEEELPEPEIAPVIEEVEVVAEPEESPATRADFKAVEIMSEIPNVEVPTEESEVVVTAEEQTEAPTQEETVAPAEATEVIAEADVATETEQSVAVADIKDPAYVEEVAKDLSAKRFGGLAALIGDKKKMRVVAVFGSIVGLSAFGFLFGSEFLGGTKVSVTESTGSSAVDTVQTPPQPVASTVDSTATGEVVPTSSTGVAVSTGAIVPPASSTGAASTEPVVSTGSTSTGVTATGTISNTGSITPTVTTPNLTPVNQIRTPNIHRSR